MTEQVISYVAINKKLHTLQNKGMYEGAEVARSWNSWLGAPGQES